jgi:hypothetical protein
MWPYIKTEPAKRNAKNRKKGTWVTKTIDTIKSEVHHKMMMDNVIPAKISKWPGGAPSYPIFVQQDNAKPHSTNGDQIIESHCIKQGPTVLA